MTKKEFEFMGSSLKLTQHFPDEGVIFEGPDIQIQTISDLGKVMLQRSIPTKNEEILGLVETIGFDIPLNVCRTSIDQASETTVISVGPNMWDIAVSYTHLTLPTIYSV